jgi:hypothetical protein
MDDLFEFEKKAEMPKQEHTQSEKFRHRCEVRWLLSERASRGQLGKVWLRDYLSKLKDARRFNLERDIRSQWMEGNRGEAGEWAAV